MSSLIRDLAASTPEMLDIFGDTALLRAALDFERELAAAQAAEGLLSDAAAAAIAGACAELPDIELLAPAAAHAGTLAIPLVADLRARLAEDPEVAAKVHLGATSQDLADTALMLQAKEGLALITRDAARLADALAAHAERQARTPCWRAPCCSPPGPRHSASRPRAGCSAWTPHNAASPGRRKKRSSCSSAGRQARSTGWAARPLPWPEDSPTGWAWPRRPRPGTPVAAGSPDWPRAWPARSVRWRPTSASSRKARSEARRRLVLSEGLPAIADIAMQRFFSEAFRARRPEAVAAQRDQLLHCSAFGYAGCCAALRDEDLTPGLGRISAPTLVIGGELDVSTPPDQAAALGAGIPGARLKILSAAHLSNLEQPSAFTAALRAHLEAVDVRT